MSAVQIWQYPWQGGNSVSLGVGKYYNADLNRLGVLGFKGIRVNDGFQAKVFRNGDLTNGFWIIPPVNYIEDLGYYSRWPGCDGLIVEKLDGVAASDCAAMFIGGAWHYGKGDYSARFILAPTSAGADNNGRFLNDASCYLYVPEDYTFTAYQHGDFKGRIVEFRSGIHDLREYGFANQISAYKLIPDGFSQYSIKFHEDQAVVTNQGALRLVEYLADNTRSDSETNFSQTLSKEVSKSVTVKWENSTSVMVGAKLIVGSEASVVKGEFNLELTNTFTIGKESSDTETETISREISKTVPPHRSSNLVLSAEYGSATIPFTATMKNNTSGALKDVKGVVVCDIYSKARGYAEDL